MMKINKLNILAATLIFASMPLHSQTPQQNLEKYWNYRTRFFDKFIVDVDWLEAPRGGINIPAGVYNPYYVGSRQRKVSWGDSQQKIALYLSSMSTEYKILELHNLDLTNVKTKLHRGITAMERLDWVAEDYFNCGLPDIVCDGITNRNGFFSRDDMTDFSFQYYRDNGKSAWSNLTLKSDYDDTWDSGSSGNVMSQDMFWHLLSGYSLVTKFVDDLTDYSGYDCAQLTLKERAIYQVYLMHRYMQSYINDDPWYFVPLGVSYPGYWPHDPTDIWDLPIYRIKNPCTGETVPAGGDYISLLPHNILFRDAAYVVTQGEWGSLNYPFCTYSTGTLPTIPISNHFFNNVGKLIPSAIANDYYANDLNELFKNIRKYADYFNSNINNNPYDIQYFTLDNLPMLNALLWEKEPTSDIWYYYYSHIEQLLNEAPSDGPKSLVFPPTEPIWTSPTIFDRPFGAYISEPANDRLLGEYNGLDYMTLFNLYILTYHYCFNDPVTVTNSFPSSYNYNTNYNWYYGNDNISIGHENNEALYTIHSKDLITMNSMVYSTGKLRLKGNEVLLQGGFEVAKYGEFIAETNDNMELDFTPPVGNYKSALVTPEPHFSESIDEEFDIESFKQFRIYPNPTNDVLNIESPKQISSIAIFSATGTIVHQSCGEGYELMSLDVSSYHPGFYIITVTADDGSIDKKALVIE